MFDVAALDRRLGGEVVKAALAEMAAQRIVERIWALDHTVWAREDREIGNRLGWLRSPDEMPLHLERLWSFVQDVRAEEYHTAVLLGMGGSSLAPELFARTFGMRPGYLTLTVLDSTDPGVVLAVCEPLDLSRTLFIVSTKSGGTVETLSAFKYFYNQVGAELGLDHAGAHFIAITDPGSLLADLATRYAFRTTFLNDPNIGGRYSALSYFGLVPAVLIGLDVPQLLAHARDMVTMCRPGAAVSDNPGAVLGAVLAGAAQAGRDKLTFVMSSALAAFGDWVEQLIAESTGKEGKGILPVVGEPLGDPALYAANDRLFVRLRLADEPAEDRLLDALEAAGQPVVRLTLRDRYDIGAQFFLWELATAVAGHRLGINPFDQPNVESAKLLARRVVAEYTARGALPAEPATLTADGIDVYAVPGTAAASAASPQAALREFIAPARPGDYLALHAYIQATPLTDAALQALRLALRDRLRIATTLGYGPRFLHSTGQLHKGDAGRGLFIQITADDARDVPIPDEAGNAASSLRFGVLKMAQALGDRRALLDAGRRVIRFHLADVVGGLDRLTRAATSA
jgi:glucose-6-phosphate isomerase